MQLHPEKFLNPYMTVCPQCGEEANELILVGVHDTVYRCVSCGMKHIGRPKGGACQKCFSGVVEDRKLEDNERLPASQPCEKCQKLNEAANTMVAAGGIHWKCKKCGSSGAIKADHPYAKDVRKQMGIEPPDPCGIEFDEDTCPLCTKQVDPKDALQEAP